jgi:aminotransferase EvaB
MIKSWSYKKEYALLRKQILNRIDSSLNSGSIFFGKQIKKFENNFSKYNKIRYITAVGSGTDALCIALISLGVEKGDEVITVSNTAIATVSAIVTAGATPRFVDVDDDYLIDVTQIEKKITKKTKVIIPVHLYGQSCQIDKICKIAKKYKLKIIEDCAQAQGAKFKNQFVGTFGDMSCFSFYPTKILGAYGDGGMICTNNKSLYEKIRQVRFYGIDQINKKNKFYKKYYANIHGINSRIDEIQCAILNLKLPFVTSNIEKRRRIAKIYKKELKDTGIILPREKPHNKHAYHLFVVFHKKRELIFKRLKKHKIFLSIQYPYPIHKMKGYNKYNRNLISLPKSEKFSKGIFSLPIYPMLEVNEILTFVKILKKIVKSI